MAYGSNRTGLDNVRFSLSYVSIIEKFNYDMIIVLFYLNGI